MFTSKLAGASAAAVLTALIPLGAAQAYVEPTIEVSVSDTTVVEGSTFTAKASSNISCDGWTLAFDGTAEKGSGKVFSADFTAPDVSKTTKLPLVGTCGYDDTKLSSAPATAANAATVVPAASQALSRTITITVLPKGGDGDGALPDTGGSNLPLLLIGGMLVVAGGGVTYAARRRGASA